MTVQHSLERAYRQLGIPVKVYHAHALNLLDRREEFVRKTRKNPQDSISAIAEWRKLRQDIDSHPEIKWNIINLVRDPVALKVSALFQVMYQHIPDWQKRLKAGILDMSELDELFYEKQEFGFKGLDRWYDNQIKAIWGIDIYASPFPKEAGYQIYQAANINLMIIRLEDLNRVAEKAFDDFLGLKDFKVSNVNVGEDKEYADLYKAFKSRPLAEDYVMHGYETRFARHFYTADEIETSRKRWLQIK